MSSWLQQMCFLNFASAVREAILCKDLGLVERFSNISNSELYWRIRIVIQNLTMCVGWPYVQATHNCLNRCEPQAITSKKNKHKRLHGLHWTAMQRRHFADCLATGFAVVSTASTESFSSLRLGFLILGYICELHQETWHSLQQGPVEWCWMTESIPALPLKMVSQKGNASCAFYYDIMTTTEITIFTQDIMTHIRWPNDAIRML